jgi:Protein of unknown function (DUF2786)
MDQKLLERIKKLQAKADNLKGLGPEYEAEAASFAAAVQKMLVEYDLDMSDVDYRLSLTQDPVRLHEFRPADFGLKSKKREILWEQALAATVAKAHQCGIIPVMSSNHFYLVGRRHHRQVAEYMIVFLFRTVEELADKAYVKRFYELRNQGLVKHARGYRASFIEACVSRLIKRYREAEHATIEGLSAEQRKVAVVRLSQEHTLIKAALDDLKKSGFIEDKDTTPLGNNKVNELGFQDGDAAGRQINLKPNVAPGQPTSPRAVGAGQKLLGRGA